MPSKFSKLEGYFNLIIFGLPFLIPLGLVFGLPAWLIYIIHKKYGRIPKKLAFRPMPKRKPWSGRRAVSVDRSWKRKAFSSQKARRTGGRDREEGGRLLMLPVELRQMIWRALMVSRKDARIDVLSTMIDKEVVRLETMDCEIAVSLLRANRQIYLECADILYKENRLCFYNEEGITSFVRTVSPTRLAQIHTMDLTVAHIMLASHYSFLGHLCLNDRTWKRACQDLESFTGLKKLTVTLDIHSESDSVRGNWFLFAQDPSNPWVQQKLKICLKPLENVRVVEGGSFVLYYPWPRSACSQWPKGQFSMRHLSESEK